MPARQQAESAGLFPAVLPQTDPEVTVSFGHATYLVREAESVSIPVVLSADPERTLVIPITVTNQGPTSGADYLGVNETVTFNSGDTQQVITLTANVDSDDDDWESVRFGFGTDLPPAVTTADPSETVVSIVDSAPATLASNLGESWDLWDSLGNYEMVQGFVTGTNHAGYTITAAQLSFARFPAGTSTAHFQLLLWPADSSGTEPAREAHSQIGEFVNPGTFSVRPRPPFKARNDIHLEPGTRYFVLMRSTTGSPPRMIGTRSNSESGADGWTIDSGSSRRSANADDDWVSRGATYRIKLYGYARPDRTPPSLSLATVNRTSLVLTYDEPLDESSVPAPSTFSVSVNAEANAIQAVAVQGSSVALTLANEVDSGDVVTISYTPPTSNPVRNIDGTPATALAYHSVTYIPEVSVSFGHGTYLVREGQSASVTVILSDDPDRSLAIPITVSNQHGASDDDYSGVNETVTFNSGDTQQVITLTATDDTDDDDWESVRFGFGTDLPPAVTTADPAETVVSIVDSAPATMVSNASASWDLWDSLGNFEMVQGFVTGTNPAGYTITAAQVSFARFPAGTSTGHFQLLLWPADPSGAEPADEPNSQIGEFVNPNSFSGSPRPPFQARNDIHLEPGTRYYVLMRSSAGLAPRVIGTRSTSESGEDGWTIDSGSSRRSANTTNDWVSRDSTYRIKLYGYARPDHEPPDLTQATVNGTSLVLTYDEPLDEDSVPGTNAFVVGVNGVVRGIDSVAVEGSVVTLTLESAASADDVVTLSYTVPTTQPVRDVARNLASSLLNHSVTNATPSAPDMSHCITETGATCSEPTGFDLADTHADSPHGRVALDAPATGYISPAGDRDVFRVDVEPNRVYHLEVKGADTGDGTLADPALQIGWPGNLQSWFDNNQLNGGSPNAGTGRNEKFTMLSALEGTAWRFRVGGNGGTGTYVVTLTDVSGAVFTSPDNVAVPENTTSVVTVVAEDIDDDETVSAYGIMNAHDHRHFSISSPGGALSFKNPPDYENPGDINKDNVYVVIVRATTGPDRRTSYQRIEITVTDIGATEECSGNPDSTCSEHAGFDLAGTHEGLPHGRVAPGMPATGTISPAGDRDVFMLKVERNREYALEVKGADTGDGSLADPVLQIGWPGNVQSWFDNNQLNGGSPDAGAGRNERFTIFPALEGTAWRFRIQGNGGTGTYTVVLTDISNAIFTSPDRVKIRENTTDVVTVVAEDVDDGETVSSYRIEPLQDHKHFKITSPEGVLTFRKPPDYENPLDGDKNNVYVVIVSATSGPDRLTSHQRIEITVTDVDDADDCAADSTTICMVSTNGTTTTGTIENDGDVDWFSATLESRLTYIIDVKGNSATPDDNGGTLEDPQLTIHNTTGTEIAGQTDDNGGQDRNARYYFTAHPTGTYYIAVSDPDNEGTGTYTVSIAPSRNPFFTNDHQPHVPENTTSVLTVVAQTTNAGQTVTAYDIVGGEDQNAFSITNPAGVLTFRSPPDYDNPTDADADNVYLVTVEATFENPGMKSRHQILVTVVNDRDDSLAEAMDLGDITNSEETVALSHTLASNDMVDYFKLALTRPKILEIKLRELDQNADLYLENSVGEQLMTSVTDGAADEKITATLPAGIYYIRVEAREAGANFYLLLYVALDPPQPATFTNSPEVSVPENHRGNLLTVVAVDMDEGHETTAYEIDGGPDDFWFDITSPAGELSFFFVPDYEQPLDANEDNVYEVVVKATSGPDNLSSYQTIRVTVTDAHDPDDCFDNIQTKCVVPADGTPKPGEIERLHDRDFFKADLVAGTEYQIDVQGNTSQPLENGGTLDDPKVRIYDPNGAAVSDGADDNTGFGNNPRLLLTPESTGTYLIVVSGPHNPGSGTGIGTYALLVADDHIPSFTSPGRIGILENNTAIISVTAIDYDVNEAVDSYAIVGGADKDRFGITSPGGVLTFISAPDYEQPRDADHDNVYQVEVRASSSPGDGTAVQMVFVAVIDDSSEPPQSVSEINGVDFTSTYSGTPQGAVVPGSPATGTIGSSQDRDVFRLNGHKGRQYRVDVKGSPTSDGTLSDPELWIGWPEQPDEWHPLDARISGQPNKGAGNNESYQFNSEHWGDEWLFRVGSNGGTGTYTISVTDMSNAIFTSPDRVRVPENTTAVVTVVAEDVDDGDEVTGYSIVSSHDHRYFNITSPGGVLTFKNPPDYEDPKDRDRDNVYEVLVEVSTGADGLLSEQKILVTVADVDEPSE